MRIFLIILVLCHSLAWAKLEFEAQLIEIKVPLAAEKATVDFAFTNTGTEAVTIDKVAKDCICLAIMVKDGKMVYQPGESGLIRTVFEVGVRKGVVDQNIDLYLKGDPKDQASFKLTARITIPELITLKPKSLKWLVGAEAEPQAMEVSMHPDHLVHITKTTSTSPNYETRVETIEKGKLYKVWVTPKDTSGPGIAAIGIETDSQFKDENTQQGFAMVERPVK